MTTNIESMADMLGLHPPVVRDLMLDPRQAEVVEAIHCEVEQGQMSGAAARRIIAKMTMPTLGEMIPLPLGYVPRGFDPAIDHVIKPSEIDPRETP